ncbi:MAG: sulfite exporter TauE/SafE family protein [Verrucomicrobiales bacterium]|nr:sulfite exporter TauE/SafE family protein [Verrucomicrobiales bacterium]
MTLLSKPKPHPGLWYLWMGAFYLVWAWLVFGHGRWNDVIEHWGIAVAMAIGSYAAGSTPMGGGTVGFPILVLLFKQSAELGRDFSFAVQSIGMTSAAIFIMARRQALAWAMLKGAALGILLAVPVGVTWFAPLVPSLWIKLMFAVVWGGFGLLHLWRIGEIAGHEGMTEFDERWDFRVGLATGLLSGLMVVSVTGVGVDMVLYTILVLLCRADLKIAIPTSVVIMAFGSLVGIATKALTSGVQPGVYENWLAAAPIVALGAPLGVFMVNFIGRKPTLYFVAVLCVGQFAWTCYVERSALGTIGILTAIAAVGLMLWGFERLRIWGGYIVGEQKRKNARRALTEPPLPERIKATEK